MERKVRRVNRDDHEAIEILHMCARRKMPWLWWWEEHLADESFLVVEQDGELTGALFAWADGSPTAWVRLAAFGHALDVGDGLDLLLPPLVKSLRGRGEEQLAWMDYDEWAGPCLAARGFAPMEQVITLIKRDRALPAARPVEARVRPAIDVDTPILAAVNRAAFTPPWWHSERTVARRIVASPHLAVAEVGRAVVGYVDVETAELGLPPRPRGHINRIVVHPAYQGRGVGALLLADALRALWDLGVEDVTLNTQETNAVAQRLYHRFGFEPTGEVVCAWSLPL